MGWREFVALRQPPPILIFLLIFYYSFTTAHGFLQSNRQNLLNGTIGTPIVRNISNGAEDIYQYTIEGEGTNVRIKTEVLTVNDNSIEHPVIFQVRQYKLSQSWWLPQKSINTTGENYAKSERTLCSLSQEIQRMEVVKWLVTVTVSTRSEQLIQYSITVVSENDLIEMEQTRQVQVFPMSPQLLHFTFPQLDQSSSTDVDLLIESQDQDPGCLTVSLQHPNCPLLDLETNIRYEGYWHTMVHKGGMTIPRHMFPDGLFIMLVMHDNDDLCNSTRTIENESREVIIDGEGNAIAGEKTNGNRILFLEKRGKRVNVSIKKSVTQVEYHLGWTLPLMLLGLLFICRPLLCLPLLGTKVHCYRMNKGSKEELIHCNKKNRVHRLSRKSGLFLHSTLIVAVFYSLPAIQLAFMHLSTMRISGNLDMCYYNFYCAVPVNLKWLGITLSDFNHCYSNIGYVMLGILGWMVVKSKETQLETEKGKQDHNMEYAQRHSHSEPTQQENERGQGDPETGSGYVELKHSMGELNIMECGIPPHFGIFYALCVALVVEGILSASYHVCPNHANFHRDTCFMYVSIMLTTLKLYHGRHYNSSTSAITAFICVGLVLALDVFAEKLGRKWFWTIFTLLHFFSCLLFSAQVFHMGQLRIGGPRDTLQKIWITYRNDNEAKPTELKTDPSVYLLIMLGNVFNLIWLLRGVVIRPDDFGSHLLMLLGGNMVLYFGYYLCMKIWHKEKISAQFWILLVLASICWIWGGAYFYQPKTKWEETPAIARNSNKECMILNFYDSHDLWHFLSALGLFLTMTALLIIDDDLIDTPRDEITIF